MATSSAQLATTVNLISGTQSTLTLVMPTTDTDGNPLSDGITCGISFDGAITTLTLSGSFQTTAPTSASAGAVMNFRYSGNTQTWWNA